MKIRPVLYNILHYSGFNYLSSLFLRNKIFIFMYHSIVDGNNRGNLYDHISIDSDMFEKQLIYLKNMGHTFMSFSDLKNIGDKKIIKPTIIYFDDGFKNFITTALPILEKHKIPATLFLVTGILDKTDIIWTILYREALTKKGVPKDKQVSLIHEIKTKTENYRKKIMSKYRLSDYEYLFGEFLTWDDIRNLVSMGIEIGSHSVSHTRLTECSAEEFSHEIRHSGKRINDETGVEVKTFSFPHGRGDRSLANGLARYGYQYAVSSGKGLSDKEEILNGGVSFLRNISPKPGESLTMFKIRTYFLNLKK